MGKTETITAVIEINKVQTLADNGFRWTLDAPETAVMQSAALMAMRQAGVAIEVTFKPVQGVEKHKPEVNY